MDLTLVQSTVYSVVITIEKIWSYCGRPDKG